jgi:HEAT repeat protein
MAQATKAMGSLDDAFAALKTYDWGSDIRALDPIDKAIEKAGGKHAECKALEARLEPVLRSVVPRAAKEFVCRKLAAIGSAHSVPALAALLTTDELGQMARYALERIPGPEADKALRDALPKAAGMNRIGIINSLGARRDAASTARLAALISGQDAQTAAAAATALAEIGTPEAAKALAGYLRRAPKECRNLAAGASLECAERLLRQGKREDALAILRDLGAQGQPAHIRSAARRALSEATRA